VPDGDDGGAARRVEKSPAVGCKNVAAFAANGLRIRLPEISGKEGVAHRTRTFKSSAILADADIPEMRIPVGDHSPLISI
jgi:hypothetical protein